MTWAGDKRLYAGARHTYSAHYSVQYIQYVDHTVWSTVVFISFSLSLSLSRSFVSFAALYSVLWELRSKIILDNSPNPPLISRAVILE